MFFISPAAHMLLAPAPHEMSEKKKFIDLKRRKKKFIKIERNLKSELSLL
jgi:hypothetical protein